jgi:predicted GNAT family N-acyltransferase
MRTIGTGVPCTAAGEMREPLVATLGEIVPVKLEVVEGTAAHALWRELVGRHHYLGHATPFGAQLRYFLRSDRAGVPVYAKIGRMAVLRERRIAGAGRAILDTLVAEAVRRGVRHLVLHAQVHAIGFYQRCGFTVVGDEFDEAGIPHRRMERILR